MADTAAALIDYATDAPEQPADRLMRRVIGCFAILSGGGALVLVALHVALARGWVASPTSMSWAFDAGWTLAVQVAQRVADCLMVLGGVLLLKRLPVSIVILRVSAVGSIILSQVSLAALLIENRVLASYWSTPAAAAWHAAQHLEGSSWEVLLLLLTLPPLARRMV